ncbi:MAG: tRNA (N(6)-L-threonylcarbamoyladenosine(37)-C(2))-methylthiotransferase MtaB [Proteobacteria bacterium]|nr:tRNA (N(6)-L-threonylcarbamoyladenosine(37)-C(2))-methylthiotransferase MtaB [Pseudomonadota bacterium]
MRVYLEFLGCRLNEAELSSWHRQLLSSGGSVVSTPEEADVLTLNTCAVTKQATRKSKQKLRSLHRRNPKAKIVATGCYATLEPEKLKENLGVDLLVSNTEKDNLVSLIRSEFSNGEMPQAATNPHTQSAFSTTRTRAFVKVQDGCRNRCSFCIVTVARGVERSRSIKDIISELHELQSLGHQEVVLTGVHLGGYGSDLGSNLQELVEAVLKDTSIPRIRLGSLEPWDLPKGFFKLWKNPRLCPHLHMPLQSGSNTILKRMIRRCTVEQYKTLTEDALQQNPDFHISSDIIVGFPGETQVEFDETLKTIDSLPFGDLHLFTYSPRSGTAATRLPNHVPKTLAKERHKILKQLASEKYTERLSALDKTVRTVLWERDAQALADSEQLKWNGYTDNYFRVEFQSKEPLFNQIKPHLLAFNAEQNKLLALPL